jgi:hypothetical protein
MNVWMADREQPWQAGISAVCRTRTDNCGAVDVRAGRADVPLPLEHSDEAFDLMHEGVSMIEDRVSVRAGTSRPSRAGRDDREPRRGNERVDGGSRAATWMPACQRRLQNAHRR